MYVSVLPIFFTAIVVSLIHLILNNIWLMYNRYCTNPILNLIACQREIGGRLVPEKYSLIYFFSIVPPNIDAVYVIVHIVMYALLAIAFAKLWVSVAGMTAEEQAKRIVESGLSIPGFRPSVKIISKYLERYINTLTVVSGLIAGIVAALGDIFGVYGGGIGLILLVEIIVTYYAIMMQEHIFEAYPFLKRLIEKK